MQALEIYLRQCRDSLWKENSNKFKLKALETKQYLICLQEAVWDNARKRFQIALTDVVSVEIVCSSALQLQSQPDMWRSD